MKQKGSNNKSVRSPPSTQEQRTSSSPDQSYQLPAGLEPCGSTAQPHIAKHVRKINVVTQRELEGEAPPLEPTALKCMQATELPLHLRATQRKIQQDRTCYGAVSAQLGD